MWESLPIEIQEHILQINWKESFSKVLEDINEIDYKIFDETFSERRNKNIVSQQYNQDSKSYFRHIDAIKSTHIHYLSIDAWEIHLPYTQLKRDKFFLHKDIKVHRRYIDSTNLMHAYGAA